MITEDYCSPEISRLLEENGFIEDSKLFYPTHQRAMKWLREEKYVIIFVEPAKDDLGNLTYLADVWIWNDEEGLYEPTWAIDNYVYEQAVEAALKYSLENLI